MMSDLEDLYQEVILDHNRRPRNFHAMEAGRKAEGYNPLCGDRLTVYLHVTDGIITDASFQGSGCAISKASASLMTDSVKGKTMAEAEALFERFHRMVTTPPEETGRGPGQAVGARGRSRVSGAREVREPGVAHASRRRRRARRAGVYRMNHFDDFLLTPQLGVVPSRDPAVIDLTSRFSEHLTLKRPIVSANMDTVTRAAMAIVLAEEGGIGVIDRGFRAGDIAPQVAEVAAVKRTQHGIIADPHAIDEDRVIADAVKTMKRTGVGTLAVVDGAGRLKGLLTERDVRFVAGERAVGRADDAARAAGRPHRRDLAGRRRTA